MSDKNNTPETILIVDDNSKNIQVLASILNDYNYKIKAATNGVQALDMIENSLPDLILLDVMMPELDGFQTCERLKSSDRTKNIPIIFLTAKVETEDIVQGFKLGAVDYITKPFYPEELIARVTTHLDLKKSKDIIEKISFERKELLHILSHDLINSMGYCITALEMVKEDPDFLKDVLDNMLGALKNGVEVVDMVRQMRALEEYSISKNLMPTSLTLLVTEATQIIKQKLTQKNLTLNMDISEDFEVLVERISFINSVFLNIMTNAIKFSFPGSSIDILAKKEKDKILLSIKDSGIGIPQEILNDIFDMSKATSRKGTNNEPGTGFGMPLVKKFVSAYGGEITIESVTEENQAHGTTITLFLKSQD